MIMEREYTNRMNQKIQPYQINIVFPQWVNAFLDKSPEAFPGIEERMRFVIALSEENIRNETGGPFGAAIFDNAGKLIAPGINMVIPENCSVLHAEMVAIMMAQKKVGNYDLSNGGKSSADLFSTTEPCAMCFGAIPWSGVNRLVCGARCEDAEALGFDEGPKPKEWVSALNQRGIDVVCDVLRDDAKAVLNAYAKTGGLVYNPERPS